MDRIVHSHFVQRIDDVAPDAAEVVREWASGKPGADAVRGLIRLVLLKAREELQSEAAFLFQGPLGRESAFGRSQVCSVCAAFDKMGPDLAGVLDVPSVAAAVEEARSLVVPDARRWPDLTLRRAIRNLVYAPGPAAGDLRVGLLAVNLDGGGDLTVEEDALRELASLAAPVFFSGIDGGVPVPERELVRLLARLSGRPEWDPLRGPEPAAESGRTLGEEQGRRRGVLPLEPPNGGGVPALAAGNPFDQRALNEAGSLLGAASREVFVAAASDVEAAYALILGEPLLHGSSEMAAPDSPDASTAADPSEVDPEPAIRLLDDWIHQAFEIGAQELHLEPGEREMRVRVRVDGACRELRTVPRTVAPSITGRLKVMAEMDIAERRVPQDGVLRLTRLSPGRSVTVRVSTVPGIHGERLCLTFLRDDRGPTRLDELDYSPANLARYRTILARPAGVLLHVGPGQSGRTTAIYAALRELVAPERVLLTAEDPVECRIPGVQQSEVNAAAGVTFARLLRHFHRQGPDAVMVGRIEDYETADLVFRSALNGMLVFSTLHVPDSVEGIVRLRDMGVEPYFVAHALVGVVAHRLVPRLCECRLEEAPTDAEREMLVGALGAPVGRIGRRGACARCGRTGVLGRVGLHEVLDPRGLFRDGLGRWRTGEEYRERAVQEGMRTLLQDALEKVAAGRVTLPDAMRAQVR